MSRASFAQSQIPAKGKDAVPYPDWRTFINGVFIRSCEAITGTVQGTGAGIDVPLPFDPAYVVCEKTAGTNPPVRGEKFSALSTDNAIKTIAAGTRTVSGSMITLGTGKFTIGTDAGLNENGQPIRWLALGFSDLAFAGATVT